MANAVKREDEDHCDVPDSGYLSLKSCEDDCDHTSIDKALGQNIRTASADITIGEIIPESQWISS